MAVEESPQAVRADRRVRHRLRAAAGAAARHRARAAGVRRHRRRDARGLDREGRRDRARHGARGGRRARGVGDRRFAEDLAAACRARQRRRRACARFRFHLPAGPAHGAGDPGAAAARRGDRRDGAELLAAFIAGFEVCSRLSRANPTHNGAGAWHGTSTIGTVAAACACARLLKACRPTHSRHASGSRCRMASGVNANYGTMTKPLHAGHAARNGIDRGDARRAGLHRQPGGARRPRRLLRRLRARHGLERRAVRRSRPDSSIWPSAASGPSAIRAAA